MPIIQNETAKTILGVAGTALDVSTFDGTGSAKNPGAIGSQKWRSESRPVDAAYWGAGRKMRVELRFDDNCKNGHQSFALTGEIYRPGARDFEACGCLHTEAAQYFPELLPLIQWHLNSQDSPMHYVANAVYHASNRDVWGKLDGEPHGWRFALTFGENPILHKLKPGFLEWLQGVGAPYDLEVLPLEHDGRGGHDFKAKWTFGGYGAQWHDGPFDSQLDAVAFLEALQTCEPYFTQYATLTGEGKARDFDAARAAANWPEATEAELSVSKTELTRALEKRLPPLQADFHAAMTQACGFIWQGFPLDSLTNGEAA